MSFDYYLHPPCDPSNAKGHFLYRCRPFPRNLRNNHFPNFLSDNWQFSLQKTKGEWRGKLWVNMHLQDSSIFSKCSHLRHLCIPRSSHGSHLKVASVVVISGIPASVTCQCMYYVSQDVISTNHWRCRLHNLLLRKWCRLRQRQHGRRSRKSNYTSWIGNMELSWNLTRTTGSNDNNGKWEWCCSHFANRPWQVFPFPRPRCNTTWHYSRHLSFNSFDARPSHEIECSWGK